MAKGDFKIFLKYVFSLRGFLESFRSELRRLFEPKTFSSILFFVAIYFLLKLESPNNRYVAAALIFVAILLQLRVVYKGGDHRRWWKQKQGIPSRKKSLRQEHNEDEGELNEENQS